MPSSLNGIGVTFNDGTQLQSANEAGGNYVLKTFTAPGTYTKPAGLKAVKVTVIGGGGGGGGARGGPNSSRSAGHGGAGGVSIRFLPAPSIPGPVAVTRGAGGGGGGSGPTESTTAGGVGGTSSFGGFLSATGGSGAIAAQGSPNIGGLGSGGNINLSGGCSPLNAKGRNRATCNNQFSFARHPIIPGTGNGQAGTAFGGGGTGAASFETTAQHFGGVGGVGLVIIEEFF